MKQKKLNNGDWMIIYGDLSWTAPTLEEAQRMAMETLGGAC